MTSARTWASTTRLYGGAPGGASRRWVHLAWAVWERQLVNEAGLAYGSASLTMRAQDPPTHPNCALRVLCDVCGSVDDV